MNNATTFVGLDVHARSVKAYAFVPETGETIRKSFGYEPGEIASWVSSLPQPARCVYESGVTGFHLCRELNAMGVDCVVGAVSKMHKPAADRGRKTDRRDAQFLAVQLALGVVTEVHVPDPECEGARSDASLGRRARRRGARQTAPVEVPAQAWIRVRREERRRAEEEPLDPGFLGVGRPDRPGRRLRDGHPRPLLRMRPGGRRAQGRAR